MPACPPARPSARTVAPGAHQGSRYFRPGTIEEGYIEQVVDLLGPNVTAGDIDGQDLELVFGGRIRAAVETPRDRGAIEIRFLDAGNAEMGAPVPFTFMPRYCGPDHSMSSPYAIPRAASASRSPTGFFHTG